MEYLIKKCDRLDNILTFAPRIVDYLWEENKSLFVSGNGKIHRIEKENNDTITYSYSVLNKVTGDIISPTISITFDK